MKANLHEIPISEETVSLILEMVNSNFNPAVAYHLKIDEWQVRKVLQAVIASALDRGRKRDEELQGERRPHAPM